MVGRRRGRSRQPAGHRTRLDRGGDETVVPLLSGRVPMQRSNRNELFDSNPSLRVSQRVRSRISSAKRHDLSSSIRSHSKWRSDRDKLSIASTLAVCTYEHPIVASTATTRSLRQSRCAIPRVARLCSLKGLDLSFEPQSWYTSTEMKCASPG